jgi:hypothetical protein
MVPATLTGFRVPKNSPESGMTTMVQPLGPIFLRITALNTASMCREEFSEAITIVITP